MTTGNATVLRIDPTTPAALVTTPLSVPNATTCPSRTANEVSVNAPENAPPGAVPVTGIDSGGVCPCACAVP